MGIFGHFLPVRRRYRVEDVALKQLEEERKLKSEAIRTELAKALKKIAKDAAPKGADHAN